MDGGSDAGVDGGSDAGVDGGSDAGPDAGFDGGIDAAEVGSAACTRPGVLRIEGQPGTGHPFVEVFDTSKDGTPWTAELFGGPLSDVYLSGFSSHASVDLSVSPVSVPIVTGRVYRDADGFGYGPVNLLIASSDPVCPWASHRFIVDGYTKAGGKLVALRTRFDATCVGGAQVRGCAWYDSTVTPPPLDAGTPALPPLPTDGGVLGDPGPCAGDNTFFISADPGDDSHYGATFVDPSWGSGWTILESTLESEGQLRLQYGLPPARLITELRLSGHAGPLQVGTLYATDAGTPGPGVVYGASLDYGDYMQCVSTTLRCCPNQQGAFQLQKLQRDIAGNISEIAVTFVGQCPGYGGGHRGCVHIARSGETGGALPAGPIEWVRHFPVNATVNSGLQSLAVLDEQTAIAAISVEKGASAGFGPVGYGSAANEPLESLVTFSLDGGVPLALGLPGGLTVSSRESGELLATASNAELVAAGLLAADAGPSAGASLVSLSQPAQVKWVRPLTDVVSAAPAPGGDVVVVLYNYFSPLDVGCGAPVPAQRAVLARLAAADGHCLWRTVLPGGGQVQVDGAGQTYFFGYGPGSGDTLDIGCGSVTDATTLLFKLDAAGACKWMKSTPSEPSRGTLAAASMVLTSDGELIVAGPGTALEVEAGCGATGPGGYLAKRSTLDGHCIWTRATSYSLSSGYPVIYGALAPDHSGGAMIISDEIGFVYVAHLIGTDGAEVWSAEIPGFWIDAAAQTPGGQWFAGGFLLGSWLEPGMRVVSSNGGMGKDMVLLKLRVPK